MAGACGSTIDELLLLNAVFRGKSDIQQVLTQDALFSAYYRNTVHPVAFSGAVDSYVNRRFSYPFTVGIYPAVSCMLSCGFCGSERGKKYDPTDVRPGNKLLRQLFAEAPNDRLKLFYLSGGLEPLTTTGLGDLVRFAASRGFRIHLYTNAMMLTPRYLERHDGLWDLDTIRISFYAATDDTTLNVTQRKGVASQVIANAKSFVQLKAERKSIVRLGFNYVVQRGQIAHLRDVGRAIVEIADQAPDRKGVNFLSLREDYTAFSEAAILGVERE